jgi:hypothetical protein
MDYTAHPGRNNVPGDYNLNLLKELYGTPTEPLTDSAVGSFANQGDNVFDGSPDQSNERTVTHSPLPMDDEVDNDQEEDQKENGGERERIEEDRRLVMERRWLEEIHQFEIQVSTQCFQEHCVFDYGNGYRVEVSQYFAPTMAAKLTGLP